MLNWIVKIELFIWTKMDLALNNLKWLMCHKTKPNQTNTIHKIWKRHTVLYCIPTEPPIRRFVWVSIKGQLHIFIDKNQTSSPHHGVWGGHYRWWRYASIRLSTRSLTQHGGLNQVPGGSSANLVREGGNWKQDTAPYHATQVGKPSVDSEKISATTLSLTFDRLTPQLATPLIIMWEVRLSEKPTKLRRTLKMNWRQR